MTGNHRLIAIKYDASAGTFDPSWHNVSTLNGAITPEDDVTEVILAAAEENAHRQFAAVRDSAGNIHAVYTSVKATPSTTRATPASTTPGRGSRVT